jgi:hypothetical protein
MNQIEQLREDYKRKVETMNIMIKNATDEETIYRLSTKRSCYRTFISELEKIKESKE